MTHQIRTVLRSLALAALFPLGIAMAMLLAASAPILVGYRSYIVTTGSMEPTIHTGAVVVSKPVGPEQVRPGDVLTFYSDHQPGIAVTHRVVGVEGTGAALHIRTKGDANGSEDAGTVDIQQPLSRMAYGVPYAGYVVKMGGLSQPGVRLLLIGLGILLVWARTALAPAPPQPAPPSTTLHSLSS